MIDKKRKYLRVGKKLIVVKSWTGAKMDVEGEGVEGKKV